MKKINIVLAFISFALLVAFVFLGRSIKISDFDTATAVFIDKNQNQWEVFCEITNPSKENPYGSENSIVKGEGFTLAKALEDAEKNSKKLLYSESVRIFVLSENLKNSQEIKEYFIKYNVNMRAVTVCCEGNASQLLNPESKESVGIYLEDKIKRFCFESKTPVPKVISYLKDSLGIFVSKQATPERRETNE